DSHRGAKDRRRNGHDPVKARLGRRVEDFVVGKRVLSFPLARGVTLELHANRLLLQCKACQECQLTAEELRSAAAVVTASANAAKSFRLSASKPGMKSSTRSGCHWTATSQRCAG